MSGSALGCPQQGTAEEKIQSYIDNTDRIEVEIAFSHAKFKYGLGLIKNKFDTTIRSSIELSIIEMNVNHLTAVSLRIL